LNGTATQGTAAIQNPANSGMANLLQVVGALMLVIIVLLGCAWVLKNHGPRNLLGRVPVRVVGGVNIGGRERVLVIEVADQWIVIGATPSQITPITTLPRQNMAEDNEVPGKQFSVWLKQMMEKRNA
jgi:flagellar protein FliO/FliZ